jgi:hypothetical protein
VPFQASQPCEGLDELEFSHNIISELQVSENNFFTDMLHQSMMKIKNTMLYILMPLIQTTILLNKFKGFQVSEKII